MMPKKRLYNKKNEKMTVEIETINALLDVAEKDYMMKQKNVTDYTMIA